MRLPDFIIPGFQKSGTTALRKNLDNHPDIYMAYCEGQYCAARPEINFFCKSKGFHEMPHAEALDWYTSKFNTDLKVCGEKSPSYSLRPEFSAKRMSEVVPNVKLIFTFRNPIDRAYSAYNHYQQCLARGEQWCRPNNQQWDPGQDFIYNLKNHQAFTKYNYASTLQSYLKYFKRDKMLFVIQERLMPPCYKENVEYQNGQTIPAGQDQYSEIFNFLGVNDLEMKNKVGHARSKKPLSVDERKAAFDVLQDHFNEFFKIYGSAVKEWSDDLD